MTTYLFWCAAVIGTVAAVCAGSFFIFVVFMICRYLWRNRKK